MSERVLITSALPYANGSIHLGHLVEYIQTDIYVRFRRAIGDEVVYVCAADSHGTPIEVNAAKQGIDPKAFVEKYRAEQHEDFKRFDVGFSTYYTTDSPENERWAGRIFGDLKDRKLIDKRPLIQLYCETDKRFLPDRFVKGRCPRCDTADQYGDACEKCGSTYDPRDLKEPRCVLCGKPPVSRESEHYYVTLKPLEKQLRQWVVGAEKDGRSHLEPAVREQVTKWLDDLQDWCVSRDPPYFGFKVPGDPDKYLYVWLDAPIGYISSTEKLAGMKGEAAVVDAYWGKKAPARIEHFIGKDIVRFHTVFWPAMLMAAGLKTPARVNVHGHLTVNGEKMSKSRGTFITARTYLDAGLDPQLLRYFYAANLGPGPEDLDLSMEEFRNRVNADLANNIANLASRTCTLIEKAGTPLDAKADPELEEATRAALARARRCYGVLEFREAMRALAELANLCNKRLQDGKPWEKPNDPGARQLLYSIGKVLHALAVALEPVVPRFARALGKTLGQEVGDGAWPQEFHPFDMKPVTLTGKPPQIPRLEAKQVEALVVVTPDEKTNAKKEAEGAAIPGVITYDDFTKVELKVGRIEAAEAVPKADKLLKLTVDVGEPAARTIAAGIAAQYKPEELVGRRVIVVANLAPRALRGITSQGMLLAAGEPPGLSLVTVGDGVAPGTRVK
jgi:methionyl-tRNA synthetase